MASSSANLPYTSATSSFYTEPDPEPARLEEPVPYHEQTPFQAIEEEEQTPFQPEEPLPPPVPAVVEPSTPVSPGLGSRTRTFTRESAPEPETPAPPPSLARPSHAPGDPDAFQYDPYASSPPRSSFYTPSSPITDNTFAFPSNTHTREKSRPDLSALLGDEKPPLPSFRRERSEAGGAMSKSAILPGRAAIGKKPVGGALAALLGMDDEGEKKDETKQPAAVAASEKSTARAAEPASAVVAGPATTKPEATTAPAEAADAAPSAPQEAPLPPAEVSSAAPLTSAALETPLPPSRSASPPLHASASPPAAVNLAPKPPFDRAASEAPSVNYPYESMVSPLETGETPHEGGDTAWPANKPVHAEGETGLDEQLAALKVKDTAAPEPARSPAESVSTIAAPAETPSSPPSASSSTLLASASSPVHEPSYQQNIFGETSAETTSRPSTDDLPSASSSSSRGFRAFNGSGDEGGFGGGFGGPGTEDTDSLRGTYSRSVEVTEGEEVEADTGMSTPATERTMIVGGGGAADDQSQRKEREASAPLPPLPPQVPSIQGSPRSTQLGGSLGPTFVITVGDPQTVGSALNPAAQHTVYTVRTRTTSSAFRKNDFSVLRRYSHFVWLYEALLQNNPGVIVPGMPEKHALGRFGADFVENRRLGLQSALNKIVSHPMLVGDPDLRLFLESDTFHIDIKQRKLEPTATEPKGFLSGLSSSFSGPKFIEQDEYFDQRKQHLDIFETQLRALLVSLHTASRARSALHSSIAELQSAFLALASCDLSSTLRGLFDQAAAVQNKIHDLAEAQSQHEEQIGGLMSVAESYARLCASAKGVFGARIKAYHTWQAAESNYRKMQSAHDKAKKSGRTHSELLNLSVAEIADDGSLRLVYGNQAERKMLDAKHDFDDVSKLTKAEMARVDKEKVDDFKKALEEYADSLAARQRQVVEAWQQYQDLLVKAVEADAHPARPPAP
ncbi:Vacuolar protein sorting-associated protein vps5 [Rhodosporidiobolus nylandii]